MDPNSSYSHAGTTSFRHQQHFQSTQLPSPAQLHLQNPPFSRNTLPPIPHINSSNTRFDSSPDSSPEHGWSRPHRTSNSRDELHPSALQQQQQLHQLTQPSSSSTSIKRESGKNQGPNMPQSQTRSTMQLKETNNKRTAVEDSMSSASDFVKKLYKYVYTREFSYSFSWAFTGC
jgi:hypothetical protein